MALERARADDIARACEVRVTAALAAQLSAEQRYDQQDAEHERSTRELREQLAAAQDALQRQTGGASTELTTLTTAVAETRDTVQDVATRLGKAERRLAASPATAAGVPVVATSKVKPPKSKKPRAAAQARTPMRTTRAAAPPARGRRARDSAKQSRRRA